MGVKDDYRRLKDRWFQTKGEERERVQKELDAFFDSITSKEDEALLHEAVDEQIADTMKLVDECKTIRKNIEIKRLLANALPFISVSAFAREYFGKSASWLHQRINGNEVHGKPATFTQEELNTLAVALKGVSKKLSQAAIKIAG